MYDDLLDPVISIGTMADKVGLSVSAIRKYEEEGLIISHRTPAGHRMFSFEDIGRIQNIQHLVKEAGFNFEGIRRMQALLPCWDLRPCTHTEKISCSSSIDNSKPCWMLKNDHSAIQGNQCRGCLVYRFGSLCTEDIKALLQSATFTPDRIQTITDLLHKKRDFYKEEK